MYATKMVGRAAPERKYDLITALGTHGLQSDPHRAKLVLRFVTLLTARYNWRREELSVGQREIARLWAVTERTVKRELGKLRALGWLELTSPAARGRVARYRVNIDAVLTTTRESWPAVGPDFAARLSGVEAATLEHGEERKVIALDAVRVARGDEGGSDWSRLCAAIAADAPEHYAAWLAPLSLISQEPDGTLRLAAPSEFHATYVELHFVERMLAAAAHAGLDIARIMVAREP